ncbi:MAG TPA: DUF4328 domain-containing protein [Solirubrobacteraceae bacterium]|nr:DUF4328 domain-containing protein [Solirubrobacteraceae bacterium]
MPEHYIPLRGRVQAVTIVFVLMALLCAAAVWSGWLEAQLMDRLIAGEEVTDADATANDDRQALVGLIQFAVWIASAVVFIRWMHGAYRNVTIVAPTERRYGAGWAIGSWFVPIMNLFRPKQITNDIWRAGGRDEQDAQPGWLLIGWWTFYLLGNFVVNIAARSYTDAESADELRTGTILFMVSDVLSVVGALLAIVVVRRATDRLDEKAAATPPPAPPEPPEGDLVAPERPAGATA